VSKYKDQIQERADEIENALGRSLTHSEYMQAQQSVVDDWYSYADMLRKEAKGE